MKSLCRLSAMKFLAVDHPGTACDTALHMRTNTSVPPEARNMAGLFRWHACPTIHLIQNEVDVLRGCPKERGGGVKIGKYFVFFSNKLSCPVRKKIWVASILLTIIIIITLSINNAPTFNL